MFMINDGVIGLFYDGESLRVSAVNQRGPAPGREYFRNIKARWLVTLCDKTIPHKPFLTLYGLCFSVFKSIHQLQSYMT